MFSNDGNNFDNIDFDELAKLLDIDKVNPPNYGNNSKRNNQEEQRPKLLPIQPRPAHIKGNPLHPKTAKKASSLRKRSPAKKLTLVPLSSSIRNLDQFKAELRNRILARQVRLGKLPPNYFELNPYYNGASAKQTYWNDANNTNFTGCEFYGEAMVRGGEEEVWFNTGSNFQNEELDGQFPLDPNFIGITTDMNQPAILNSLGEDPYAISLYSFY